MVGQKTARDAAWKAIATATQRQAPVILGVEGPPGSGRSRLLSWLTELAHERGAAQVVLVEEQEHLWPALVRAAVDLREPQPSAEAYEDQISSLVPELGTYIVRVLANAAAQVPGPPEPTAGAVAQALRLRARRRPLLVAMEGPWLDRPEAHAFLHAVADLPSPVVLALECSAVAPLPPTEATTVAVHLTPTSDADLAQILDDLLPLEPQLTASVVRRAQGNPQLAIELVTDLVDRQLLLWRHGRYGLREGVVLDLPEGTREVWRQRLERALVGVVDSERTAVVLGALLGGPVPIDRWEQAARRMGLVEYQEVLGRLQRAWLVELEGDRWRFVHPVLEEVTQSLAEEAGSLSEACLAAAYVLTEASGPPGRIGRLLGRAGAHAASLAPLGLGIDDALQSGDLDAVAQLLDRRAHALHHLGAGSHDPRWLPNALGHGGLALERGDVRTARREAERAVRLAGSDGGDARAYLLHGRALQRDGRPGEARDAYSDALHHAVSDDRLLGRILFGLGELLRTQGELEAAEVHLEMAAEHVRDDPATRAAVQLAQGRVAVARGALDEAARWVTEAETWCRHLSLRRLLVAALILRGDVHRWREELIQAGQCFDQARLLCAGHESVLLATVEVQHGLACLAGRNDEEAVRHFDRADAAAQRPQADRLLLARLPMATHGSDRAFDRALDQVRRALDRHPDDPDHAFCLEVAADRARKARRKQILWAMAAEVWRSLGRPRRASLAERALATLARS